LSGDPRTSEALKTLLCGSADFAICEVTSSRGRSGSQFANPTPSLQRRIDPVSDPNLCHHDNTCTKAPYDFQAMAIAMISMAIAMISMAIAMLFMAIAIVLLWFCH